MPSSAITHRLAVALEPALEFADGDELPAAAAHDSPPARSSPPAKPHDTPSAAHESSTFSKSHLRRPAEDSETLTNVALLLSHHPSDPRCRRATTSPLLAPPADPAPHSGAARPSTATASGVGIRPTPTPALPFGGCVGRCPPSRDTAQSESGRRRRRRRTGRRTPWTNANAPSHGTVTGQNPPDSADSSRTRPDENGSRAKMTLRTRN